MANEKLTAHELALALAEFQLDAAGVQCAITREVLQGKLADTFCNLRGKLPKSETDWATVTADTHQTVYDGKLAVLQACLSPVNVITWRCMARAGKAVLAGFSGIKLRPAVWGKWCEGNKALVDGMKEKHTEEIAKAIEAAAPAQE